MKDVATIRGEITDVCQRVGATIDDPALTALTAYVQRETMNARQSAVDTIADAFHLNERGRNNGH